jgi:dTDP-4-dehydrorhamnose 3,5-epimerase-like enzyme
LAKILELNTFSDVRGDLTVIDKELPFKVKRVFYISNVRGERGFHKHKKNKQALVSVAGECTVFVNNGKEKKEFVLDNQKKCLILDPKDWHIMKNFSKDCVLLVLASEHFDKNDYVTEEYK